MVKFEKKNSDLKREKQVTSLERHMVRFGINLDTAYPIKNPYIYCHSIINIRMNKELGVIYFSFVHEKLIDLFITYFLNMHKKHIRYPRGDACRIYQLLSKDKQYKGA